MVYISRMSYKSHIMYLNNFQSSVFGATLIIMMIFMMCFVGCDEVTTEPQSIRFGESVELKTSQSIYYGSTIENGLKVSVESISDSRCPTNVQCIWAGEAGVNLNIKSRQDSTKIILKISPAKNSQPDTLAFSLNQTAYQAILYSVNPYPDTSKPQGDLKAKITISQK
jgi:hypothetical protein